MGNRRNIIIKNTGFLYVRLLLTMFLSFYTSRVILQVLGVNDFGIYSIVGSVTTTFASLKTVFSEAVLRFLNYEKGLGNKNNERRIFSLSIMIHIVVAIIFLLLVEIVGMWLIYNKLNIPMERFDAAIFVFHVSVASSVLLIFTVPYDAVIISNEKINVFAFISIFDALLKLGIIMIVPYIAFDYLKSYALLLIIVPLITLIIYIVYCRRFEECKIIKTFDKLLFKEIASYSSWNFIGNFIFSIVHECLNMLLNVYGGVLENAARNIAYQVRTLVNSFSNNMLVAVKPYVIQSSAINERSVLFNHTLILSKLAFYSSLVIAAPLVLYCDKLLDYWLPEVPEYAVPFTQLSVIAILIRSLHGPLSLMYMSLAKIKMMTIVEGVIFLLSLFVAWLFLDLGFPLWSVFALLTFVEVLTIIALAVNAKYEFQFNIKPYFGLLTHFFVLSMIVFIQIFFLKTLSTPSSFLSLLVSCIAEVLIVITIMALFLNSYERKIIREVFKGFIKKIKQYNN